MNLLRENITHRLKYRVDRNDQSHNFAFVSQLNVLKLKAYELIEIIFLSGDISTH